MKHIIYISTSVAITVFIMAIVFYNYLEYQKRKSNTIPWPTNTTWIEVTHDVGIKIIRRGIFQLPLIEYDCDHDVITLSAQFSDAICWKSRNNIMIVAYCGNRTGACFAKIDISTRKPVFFTALNGIGPLDHSQYLNSIRLYINLDLLMIVGAESYGTYREIRRIKDGSLILIDQAYLSHGNDDYIHVN